MGAKHRPHAGLSGKVLQAPWVPSGDELVGRLAACCGTRAVDQEAGLLEDVKEASLSCLAEALATSTDPAGPPIRST